VGCFVIMTVMRKAEWQFSLLHCYIVTFLIFDNALTLVFLTFLFSEGSTTPTMLRLDKTCSKRHPLKGGCALTQW